VADELLHARIAFVESNLEKIGELMDVVRKRKDRLAATEDLLQASTAQLYAIVERLRGEANRSRTEDADFRRANRLDTLASELSTVADGMSEHRQGLDRTRSVLSVIAQSSPLPFPGMQVEASEVQCITASLAEIRQSLQDTAPAAADHRKAWATFKDRVRIQAQDLFAEYVDLLGGLAVRDVGLDKNACAFVEQLFRFYALGPLPLTIPSRYSVRSRGWGRVMRVGFPEWTIWTLPLVAPDFWLAVGRSRFAGDLERAGVKEEDAAMQDCLADAFGALTLGPAYAYAAIRLRFDPFTAHNAMTDRAGRKLATDDDRVHAVLTMLRQDGNPPDFTAIADDLEAQWAEALDQAHPDGAADAGFKDRIATVIGLIAPSLRSPVDAQVGLTAEAWRAFQGWPAKLLAGEQDQIPVAGVELRSVLNAAWIARVRHEGEIGLKLLTERAEGLWNRVVEVSADAQRGRRPPQR
jgi:hypothetical protein